MPPLKSTLAVLITSLLLLTGASAIALEEATAAAQVRGRLLFAPLIKGDFSQQRQLSAIDKPLASAGRFIFWRDHGLYWETQKPFYQGTTYLAEQVLSWHRPGVPSPETGINSRIQLALGKVLVNIFNFDNALEEQFDIHWQPDEDLWQVELVPIDKHIKQVLQKITLQGKQQVEQITLLDNSGQRTVIALSAVVRKQQPNQSQCLLFYALASGACSPPVKVANDQ